MTATTQTGTRELTLRHTVATLAYRAAKVLRDTPSEFSGFQAGAGVRTPGEILAHLCDLFDWALSQARGAEAWQDTRPRSWGEDSDRFFAALRAFDDYLASGAPLQQAPERLFQGAVADALTHVGQIALLRRLAEAPIRPENYSVAVIEAGRTGADQAAPVAEY
jgi:hypothetical protein